MKLIPLNTKNVKAIWGRVGVFLDLIGLSQSAYNARVDSGEWFISNEGALVQVRETVPRCDRLALKELRELAATLEAIKPDGLCWPYGFLNKAAGVCRASIILGLSHDDPLFEQGRAGDCAKRVREYIRKLEGK